MGNLCGSEQSVLEAKACDAKYCSETEDCKYGKWYICYKEHYFCEQHQKEKFCPVDPSFSMWVYTILTTHQIMAVPHDVPGSTVTVLNRLAGYVLEMEKSFRNRNNKPKEDKNDKDKEITEEIVPDIVNSKAPIYQQEFLWDNVIQWLVAAIFGLTVLNVSTDFFRNYTVACQLDTANRDEVTYVNNFCFSSLPRSEYFTLFIIIHGFLIIGPHSLWKTIYKSYFNFFFDLANSLDRLRDRMTGDYQPRNFDIIARIENEFSYKANIGLLGKVLFKVPPLFAGYILKLLIQSAMVIASLVFSVIYFNDFTDVFECPKNFNNNNPGWHLNSTVYCVYPSLRFLSLLRYADYFLLGLILLVTCVGITWCFIRHPQELGYDKVAEVCSQSCLVPEDYTSKQTDQIRTRHDCISSDLHFLIMMLFRTSSGSGATFKDMLIENIMRKHYSKDSELLQLFLNQRESKEDAEELFKQANFRHTIKSIGQLGSPRFKIEEDYKPKLGLADDMEERPSDKEIKRLYHKLKERNLNCEEELLSKLDNEEGEPSQFCSSCYNCMYTADEQNFQKRMKIWSERGGTRKILREALKEMNLEDISKETIGRKVTDKEIKSFQNQVYRFTQLLKPHKEGMGRLLAMDISFDGVGCTYILEWALESVCSINFHSHFHNKSNPVMCNPLYNQITLIRLPLDYFSLPGTDQTKLDKPLDEVFFDCTETPPRAERRDGYGDKGDRYINFITVGPIKEDAKRVTEKLHDGKDIADNALMLAIKPLKISGNVVSDKYLRYTPSYSLFEEHLKPSPIGERRLASSRSLPVGMTRRLQQQYRPQRSLPGQEERARLMSPSISISPDEEEPSEEDELPIERKIKSIEKLVGEQSMCAVGSERGVICYCGDKECVFEMKLYHYKWKQEMRRERKDNESQISV